jgi:flagellar hook protein FlgE
MALRVTIGKDGKICIEGATKTARLAVLKTVDRLEKKAVEGKVHHKTKRKSEADHHETHRKQIKVAKEVYDRTAEEERAKFQVKKAQKEAEKEWEKSLTQKKAVEKKTSKVEKKQIRDDEALARAEDLAYHNRKREAQEREIEAKRETKEHKRSIAEELPGLRHGHQSQPISTPAPHAQFPAHSSGKVGHRYLPGLAPPGQEGTGAGKYTTTNAQINSVLKDIPGYEGCFMSDEIPKVKISPTQDTSFVLNSDPSSEKGLHWVSVWISPVKDKTVEVFDALGPDSPLNLRKVIDELRSRILPMKLPYRLKFKHNTRRWERIDGSSCGEFAMQFILDRARGKTFSEASQYDSIPEAEKSLHPLEKRFGYL